MQISVDRELLDRIDSDPEVRQKGRSAFIRAAVWRHLVAKQQQEIEARLAASYGGETDALLGEIEELLGEQTRPGE